LRVIGDLDGCDVRLLISGVAPAAGTKSENESHQPNLSEPVPTENHEMFP